MAVQAMTAQEKGLLAQMKGHYSIMKENERPAWIDDVMMVVPATGFSEKFHGFKSPPLVHVWRRGTTASFSGFDEFDHTVKVADYMVGVQWHENDEADNRSPTTIKERVRETAKRFAQLDRRVFQELVTASFSLVKYSPTCYDGNALYSTSHAERTAGSGGNSFTSAGQSTTDQIATDIWAWLNSLHEWKDSANEKWLPDDLLSRDNIQFMVVVPHDKERIWHDTFARENDVRGNSLTAVTNAVPKRFRNAKIVPYELVTGGTWRFFVLGLGDEKKPLMKLTRMEPRVRVFNRGNDGYAARNKLEQMMWDARYGFGYNFYASTAQFSQA